MGIGTRREHLQQVRALLSAPPSSSTSPGALAPKVRQTPDQNIEHTIIGQRPEADLETRLRDIFATGHATTLWNDEPKKSGKVHGSSVTIARSA